MNSGQASIELLAILGVTLLAILFFTVFATDTLAGENKQQQIRAVRLSVQQLASAADFVYSQGDGAVEMVLVSLPPDVSFDANRTYVGKPASAPASAQPNGININIYGNDIFAQTSAPLAGSFPSSTGSHLVRVESHGNFVSIGSPPSEAGEAPVTLRLKKNQQRYADLYIASAFDSPVLVNLTAQWGYLSPALSFAPQSFTLFKTGIPLRLNVTTGPSDQGVYSGRMSVRTVLAGSNSSVAETFFIPLSVEVTN